MSLVFEHYWPIALLAVIPLLLWAKRTSAVDLSPKHLRLSLLVRSGLIVLLALALMQPTVLRSSTRVATVYLLDVSHSVNPTAIQDALQWIRKTSASGNSSSSRFLAFAANSLAFDSADALAKVPVAPKPEPGAIDQSKTRLAAALDHAVRSFPPDHVKHLVLFPTATRMGVISPRRSNAFVSRAFAFSRGSMSVRSARDTWIEAMLDPATVTAEEQFPVEVHVYTQTPGPPKFSFETATRFMEKRHVTLKDGLNRHRLRDERKEESPTIGLEAP